MRSRLIFCSPHNQRCLPFLQITQTVTIVKVRQHQCNSWRLQCISVSLCSSSTDFDGETGDDVRRGPAQTLLQNLFSRMSRKRLPASSWPWPQLRRPDLKHIRSLTVIPWIKSSTILNILQHLNKAPEDVKQTTLLLAELHKMAINSVYFRINAVATTCGYIIYAELIFVFDRQQLVWLRRGRHSKILKMES